jgi:Acetyltransferases
MDTIIIKKGNPRSEFGGRLNSMALDYMAYPLIGSKDHTLIEDTFNKLWRFGSNRFSHEYAYEAQFNHQTVGMITCYPGSIMEKLAFPTFCKLMEIRKWPLIQHSLGNLKEVFSVISLNEARNDEYHIGTLATLPESRGYGVGSKLIRFVEEQARLKQFQKCSLTVKVENQAARKLYEKLGYRVVNRIEKDPYYLLRMVKEL